MLFHSYNSLRGFYGTEHALPGHNSCSLHSEKHTTEVHQVTLTSEETSRNTKVSALATTDQRRRYRAQS